eukprot:jgi/Tetstr1/435531/TSEL_024435.t1
MEPRRDRSAPRQAFTKQQLLQAYDTTIQQMKALLAPHQQAGDAVPLLKALLGGLPPPQVAALAQPGGYSALPGTAQALRARWEAAEEAVRAGRGPVASEQPELQGGQQREQDQVTETEHERKRESSPPPEPPPAAAAPPSRSSPRSQQQQQHTASRPQRVKSAALRRMTADAAVNTSVEARQFSEPPPLPPASGATCAAPPSPSCSRPGGELENNVRRTQGCGLTLRLRNDSGQGIVVELQSGDKTTGATAAGAAGRPRALDLRNHDATSTALASLLRNSGHNKAPSPGLARALLDACRSPLADGGH